MALLAGLFPWEWLHPGGSGYWFYSGVFDVGILLGILSSVGVYWRAHNCQVNRCWRLDWHPHPEHGHPVCRTHHPHGGAGFLHARHHRVKVSTSGSAAPGLSTHLEVPKATARQSQPDGMSSNGSVVTAQGGTRDESGD